MKEFENEKCEFEYDGKCDCDRPVAGIARTKLLCNRHFNAVKKDNVRRFNEDQDIPTELIFTKKLTTAEGWKTCNGELNGDEPR